MNKDFRSESVCFSGYRPEKMPMQGDESCEEVKRIKESLCSAILDAINTGYTHFIVGMAVGFDLWAGEAVAQIKREREGITLEGAFPFKTHGERLTGNDRERFIRLVGNLDKITVCSERYHSGVFHVRNRYMVDNSGLLICYWDGKSGGTAYTVGYAEKEGLCVINLSYK